MNNHNYADWEITSLLPEINLYNKDYCWYGKKDDKMSVGLKYLSEINSNPSNSNLFLESIKNRDAWTWEDIRLYLKSKRYEILIGSAAITYIATIQGNVSIILTGFNTYEEARREAIIYCLNLIKENEKTN